MKQRVIVTLDIDVDRLNGYLGNTPNVTAENAVKELIGGLFEPGWVSCENCGRGYRKDDDETPLRGTYEVSAD